jgi:uncharacterized protein (TIRG00374 family)
MDDETVATTPAPPSDRRALRRGALLALALGAAVAVGLGIATVDARTFAAVRHSPGAVALAAAVVPFAWLAEGVVFGALAGRLRPRQLVGMTGVYLGGSFPSAVTPFASGAVPAWIWLLTLEGLSSGEAAAVVGLRQIVTAAFFALAGGTAVAVVPRYLPPGGRLAFIGLLATLLATVAVAFYLAFRPARLEALARRLGSSRLVVRLLGAERTDRLSRALPAEAAAFADALRAGLRERPLALVVALAATVVSRALLFGVVPLLLLGFGWRGDVAAVYLAMLVVQTLGSATPAPGGSGVSEGSLAALLSGAVPSYLLGATVVIWRLLTFYAELIVGSVVFGSAVRRAARGRTVT